MFQGRPRVSESELPRDFWRLQDILEVVRIKNFVFRFEKRDGYKNAKGAICFDDTRHTKRPVFREQNIATLRVRPFDKLGVIFGCNIVQFTERYA